MRRLSLVYCLVLAALFVSKPVQATPLTNSRVLVRTRPGTGLDGKAIDFQGEAIQQIMRRGNHGWVNVKDDANAVGIWASASDLDLIKITGTYTSVGDTVRVTGVFHAACPEHGGDLDIHAERITLVDPGGTKPVRVQPAYALGAILALAAALGLARIAYRKK